MTSTITRDPGTRPGEYMMISPEGETVIIPERLYRGVRRFIARGDSGTGRMEVNFARGGVASITVTETIR